MWIGIAAQSLVEKGKMEIIHWCGLVFMVGIGRINNFQVRKGRVRFIG